MDAQVFVILLFWSALDKDLDGVFQLLKHFADLCTMANTIRVDSSYTD